jgi:hypothetical protein
MSSEKLWKEAGIQGEDLIKGVNDRVLMINYITVDEVIPSREEPNGNIVNFAEEEEPYVENVIPELEPAELIEKRSAQNPPSSQETDRHELILNAEVTSEGDNIRAEREDELIKRKLRHVMNRIQ